MHWAEPPQESGPVEHLQVPLSQTGVVPLHWSLHESGVWHWPARQVCPVAQQVAPQAVVPVAQPGGWHMPVVLSQTWRAMQAPQLLPHASRPHCFVPQPQFTQLPAMQRSSDVQHAAPHFGHWHVPSTQTDPSAQVTWSHAPASAIAEPASDEPG
jgi:hypothetical protein